MPSKKKKYNARFPPARIKKIMQTDEEIGKVAAAVPVIISLELFLESLLTKACHVTQSRNAKTMTTSHLKQCIELEQQFDFLKDLVAAVPDMQGEGDGENHTESGTGPDKVPRRGRKPGSGRKNGGPSAKGKEKKLSGTESEQEVGRRRRRRRMRAGWLAGCPDAPPQYLHMANMAAATAPPTAPSMPGPVPLGSFAPHPSMMGATPPAPPTSVPHKDAEDEDDDEDYDS
ncbi:hypothetical protein CRUP_023436 [Coryphaenoides rupestris]|nr:hypothetical protein CRUP_023436 [Coryphaenoides rupestris]